MALPAHPAQDARVFLFHCEAYEVERIRSLVGQAMTALDLRPRGRTLVKPNLVAAGDLFAHAYTRPEIVEGVLGALRDRESRDEAMTELAVGERCAITIPTRFAFQASRSGGDMMCRRGVLHGKRSKHPIADSISTTEPRSCVKPREHLQWIGCTSCRRGKIQDDLAAGLVGPTISRTEAHPLGSVRRYSGQSGNPSCRPGVRS